MAESLYGNERKIVLENRCSPERYEQIVSFLSAQDFHILNASYWHAEQPWEVPKREISDNLIVIVHGISPVTPLPEVRRAKFLVVFFCL